jgi:hypothetical protein
LLLLRTSVSVSRARTKSVLSLKVLVGGRSGGHSIAEGGQSMPLGGEHGPDVVGKTVFETSEQGGLVPASTSREGAELGDVVDHRAGLAQAQQLMSNLVQLVLVTVDFVEVRHEVVIGLEQTVFITDLAIDNWGELA